MMTCKGAVSAAPDSDWRYEDSRGVTDDDYLYGLEADDLARRAGVNGAAAGIDDGTLSLGACGRDHLYGGDGADAFFSWHWRSRPVVASRRAFVR